MLIWSAVSNCFQVMEIKTYASSGVKYKCFICEVAIAFAVICATR
jgi:hypothetical protein